MRPHLSTWQFRFLASAVVAAGLVLTAVWVARGRGPYTLFLAMELGEGPATHGLAAGGLTFIVVMLPCLFVSFGLRALSPLPPLRKGFSRQPILLGGLPGGLLVLLVHWLTKRRTERRDARLE